MFTALASLQTFASASLATADRYAISNVHLESGANPVRGSACARTEPIAIRSMANVCAPEAGPVTTVSKSVHPIGMDRIAAKSAGVDTVEAVITFLGSAIVLLATLGHSAMIRVHLESTATSASRNANARTVVPAIQPLEIAIVLLAGSVKSARIGVRKVSGARIAQMFATVTTKLVATISQESANANLASTTTSV